MNDDEDDEEEFSPYHDDGTLREPPLPRYYRRLGFRLALAVQAYGDRARLLERHVWDWASEAEIYKRWRIDRGIIELKPEYQEIADRLFPGYDLRYCSVVQEDDESWAALIILPDDTALAAARLAGFWCDRPGKARGAVVRR